MSIIEIIARPAGRGRYHAHAGDRYLCTAAEPFLTGARILLAQGMDPDQLVTVRHEGPVTTKLCVLAI